MGCDDGSGGGSGRVDGGSTTGGGVAGQLEGRRERKARGGASSLDLLN